MVDRGPGSAGDLGQANFGGAIHFFSLDPADSFGVTQRIRIEKSFAFQKTENGRWRCDLTALKPVDLGVALSGSR